MTITDGTYYCRRCGEDRTVCSLCEHLVENLKKRTETSDWEHEIELRRQEIAIRKRNREFHEDD